MRRTINNLIGTMPDNQIAKRFGVSREWIRVLRKRRGIPAYKRYRSLDNVDCKLEDIEGLKLVQIQAKYNLNARSARKLREKFGLNKSYYERLAEKIQKLPYKETTDKDLALELGVHWRTVQSCRLKQGLKKKDD